MSCSWNCGEVLSRSWSCCKGLWGIMEMSWRDNDLQGSVNRLFVDNGKVVTKMPSLVLGARECGAPDWYCHGIRRHDLGRLYRPDFES